MRRARVAPISERVISGMMATFVRLRYANRTYGPRNPIARLLCAVSPRRRIFLRMKHSPDNDILNSIEYTERKPSY